jgi:hydroxymethylglutaryl-CoA lyase
MTVPSAPPHTASARPDAVTLREVGLRDGLQSLPQFVPTERKLAWLRAEHAAGLRAVEVSSFVPPKLMPQLADAAEMVAGALALPGMTVTVLVPNLKGAERALAAGAHGLLVPVSASAPHSLANVRKTPQEMIREVAAIRAARDAAGSSCRIEVAISTAFGCTIQGEVPLADVIDLLKAARDAGAEELGLSDTVGFADPGQVARFFEAGRRAVGELLGCAHFHDTRGLGMANAVAAFQQGIRTFDASLGGLGGCPHAPGASGNVATEDLAFLFEQMGAPSGLDVDALLAMRQPLAQWVDGAPLHGHVWRAGRPRALRPAAAEAVAH